MQKTKIEWTDYAWNPIRGLCPAGCWYCYARKMYRRFGWDPEMRFELHDPMATDRLYRQNIPNGSKVFVCSTFELFHPKVPKSWRKVVFDVIKINPKITFQILTKFPQNIDRPMPDNVWLGATITENKEIHRVKKLLTKQAKIRFVSIEPFLRPMYVLSSDFLRKMDWIILGRLTGYGKKHDPPRTWIEGFEAFAKAMNIPLFMKDNLKEIWGKPLIQEMPK